MADVARTARVRLAARVIERCRAWSGWWPAAALGFLAATFAGQRILVSDSDRFTFIPATRTLDDWFRPGLRNLDQTIIGYVVMVAAAAGFAACYSRVQFRERAEAPREQPCALLELPRPLWQAVTLLIVPVLIWLYVVYRLWHRSFDDGLVLLVALSVGFIATSLWRLDRAAGVRFSFALGRVEAAALLLTIAAGAAVITFRLDSIPRNMIGDEGAFWDVAKRLSRGDIVQNDPFTPGVYGFPSGSSVYQSWFVSIFGESLWSWRFSSAFAAIACMPAVYFLARANFGRFAAFSAVALFATSPFVLAFARMGYNNSQSLLPITLSVLLLQSGLSRRSRLLLFSAGAVSGLGMYTYFAARITPFILAFGLAHSGVLRNLRWREVLYAAALVAAGLVLVGLLPLLRTYVQHDPSIDKKSFESLFLHEAFVRDRFPERLAADYHVFSISGVPLWFDPLITVRLLVRAVFITLVSFHHPDIVFQHHILGALGGPIVSALLIPGVALLARRWREPGPFLLASWFVFALLLLSVTGTWPPRQAHLVGITPLMAILYGAALAAVVRLVIQIVHTERARAAAYSLASLAVLGLAALGAREYFTDAKRFLDSYDHVIWFEAMDLEDGEQVAFVYQDKRYENSLPWGIEHFDLQKRYFSVPAEELDEPSVRKHLAEAKLVVMDAREPTAAAVWYAIDALPGWELEARRDFRNNPVAWVLHKPSE